MVSRSGNGFSAAFDITVLLTSAVTDKGNQSSTSPSVTINMATTDDFDYEIHAGTTSVTPKYHSERFY